jgi:hypothetical protein
MRLSGVDHHLRQRSMQRRRLLHERVHQRSDAVHRSERHASSDLHRWGEWLHHVVHVDLLF